MSDRSNGRSTGIELLAVAILFLGLGLAATWPMATAPDRLSLIRPDDNDYRFNMWVIFWGAHALMNQPADLHDANIFHPEPYTFAYSEIELSHSLLAIPVMLVRYNPILVYNMLLLASIVIGGSGAYLLARRLTGHRGAAVLGAAVYLFNPAHFARYVQIQLFGDLWLPWFALCLYRWLDELADPGSARSRSEGPDPGVWIVRLRRHRWPVAAAVTFSLNALSGSHNAVFGALLGGLMLLYYGVLRGLWRRRRAWLGLATMAVTTTAILAPILYPFLLLQDRMLAKRVEDVWLLDATSAHLYELLAANSHFYRWLDRALGWPSELFDRRLRSLLFPGVVPLVLATLGLLPARTADGGAGDHPTRPRPVATAAAWGLDLLAALGAGAALVYAVTGRVPGLGTPGPGPGFPVLLVVVVAATVVARLLFLPRPIHLLAAPTRIRPERWRVNREQAFWGLFLLVCFHLSLGPEFGLYLIVAELPATRLIRVPSRFLMPGNLALGMLAACGAARVARSCGASIAWPIGEEASTGRSSAGGGSTGHIPAPGSGRDPGARTSYRSGARALPALVLLVAGLLFAGESAHAPMRTWTFDPEPPEVYRWLGRQEGEFAVLEYPVDPEGPTIAARQTFYSIYHWKELLVGYSGWQSEENVRRLRRIARRFPEPPILDRLTSLGVRYVIVFEDRTAAARRDRIRESPRLRPVRRFGSLQVYELQADRGSDAESRGP